jgi:hypothetical protein
MKVTKKKTTFFNCSAEKRSLTLVSPFAYHRYGAEINAAIGNYWAFVCVAAFDPLSCFHLSCLRHKLRRHHGLNASGLIISLIFYSQGIILRKNCCFGDFGRNAFPVLSFSDFD